MCAEPRRDLDDAVKRQRARRDAFKHEGERSLARNLALVGTLGWLVVVPTLLGAFLGRYLDRWADSGVTFSSALICLGLAAGCWFAWQRVRSE